VVNEGSTSGERWHIVGRTNRKGQVVSSSRRGTVR
jgi:hypothetical protein